jgi:hypothetical protein
VVFDDTAYVSYRDDGSSAVRHTVVAADNIFTTPIRNCDIHRMDFRKDIPSRYPHVWQETKHKRDDEMVEVQLKVALSS